MLQVGAVWARACPFSKTFHPVDPQRVETGTACLGPSSIHKSCQTVASLLARWVQQLLTPLAAHAAHAGTPYAVSQVHKYVLYFYLSLRTSSKSILSPGQGCTGSSAQLQARIFHDVEFKLIHSAAWQQSSSSSVQVQPWGTAYARACVLCAGMCACVYCLCSS